MGDFNTFLAEQKATVLDSLDRLAKTASNIIVQKNNRILELNEKNTQLTQLNEEKSNVISGKLVDFRGKIRELRILRKNNTLERKLLEEKQKNRELKKKVHELKEELDEQVNNRNYLDPKDMTAFKIVALELEEKEKELEDSRIIHANLEKEKENLQQKIDRIMAIKVDLESKIATLENKNRSLENLGESQRSTIETIGRELRIKNEKIIELKSYFMDILNSYNDLMQTVEQLCNWR